MNGIYFYDTECQQHASVWHDLLMTLRPSYQRVKLEL